MELEPTPGEWTRSPGENIRARQIQSIRENWKWAILTLVATFAVSMLLLAQPTLFVLMLFYYRLGDQVFSRTISKGLRFLVVFVGAVLGMIFLRLYFGGAELRLICWLIVVFEATLTVLFRRPRDATPADVTLFEGEHSEGSALASVEIKREGKLIGHDNGVIWMADNLLNFKGHSCYFTVGGAGWRPEGMRSRRHKYLGPNGSIETSFKDLKWHGDPKGEEAGKILTEAESALRQELTSAEPRVLPPTEPWRRADQRFRAVGRLEAPTEQP